MQANKEAKKTVAISKAHAMDEVYDELDTLDGKRNILYIRHTKDEEGVVQNSWSGGKVILVSC